MTKPQPPEDLWQQLDAILQVEYVSSPPPESFTIPQFADKYELTYDKAKNQLFRMEEKGLVKSVMAMASTSSGARRTMRFYTLVKK